MDSDRSIFALSTLDLHSGNTARKLGLLTRKQNDWKAVEELTSFYAVLTRLIR
jgi:hypothetical protein